MKENVSQDIVLATDHHCQPDHPVLKNPNKQERYDPGTDSRQDLRKYEGGNAVCEEGQPECRLPRELWNLKLTCAEIAP